MPHPNRRLGLYVFGRRELFEPCIELRPTFSQLLLLPDKLLLLPTERHPTSRPAEDVPVDGCVSVGGLQEMVALVAALTERDRREREALYPADDDPMATTADGAPGPNSSLVQAVGGAEVPPEFDEED